MKKPIKPKKPYNYVYVKDDINFEIVNGADDKMVFLSSADLADYDDFIDFRRRLSVDDLMVIAEKLRQPGMENVYLVGDPDALMDDDESICGFSLMGSVARSPEDIQTQRDVIAFDMAKYEEELRKYEADMRVWQDRGSRGSFTISACITAMSAIEPTLARSLSRCNTKQDIDVLLLTQKTPHDSVLYTLLAKVP